MNMELIKTNKNMEQTGLAGRRSTMGKATIDLIHEHETIMHVLELLKKIQGNSGISEESQLKFYGELAYFLEVFADKCHHGKEENNMYHTLAPLGDEAEKMMIITLIEEHVEARALVREIKRAAEAGSAAEAAEAAESYRVLLQDHIRRENEEMFPSIQYRIKDQQQDVMFEHFMAVEERTLGGGVKEKLMEMIKGWESLSSL